MIITLAIVAYHSLNTQGPGLGPGRTEGSPLINQSKIRQRNSKMMKNPMIAGAAGGKNKIKHTRPAMERITFKEVKKMMKVPLFSMSCSFFNSFKWRRIKWKRLER